MASNYRDFAFFGEKPLEVLKEMENSARTLGDMDTPFAFSFAAIYGAAWMAKTTILNGGKVPHYAAEDLRKRIASVKSAIAASGRQYDALDRLVYLAETFASIS